MWEERARQGPPEADEAALGGPWTTMTDETSVQLQALGLLSIRLLERGVDVALVFFGLHCLAIGWLIIQRLAYAAEVVLCLWFIAKGVNAERWKQQAGAAA